MAEAQSPKIRERVMVIDQRCACGAQLYIEYTTGNREIAGLVDLARRWVDLHAQHKEASRHV